MDNSILSSRSIMGMYFARLEQNPGMGWIDAVSNLYTSDQASETYKFLGQTPTMREWVGGRLAKGFSGNGITVVNKHYEATIEVAKKDVRRDKTPQLRARMAEFADRGQTHWASLMTTLLINGPSTACYDGQYFFDTDHSEGDSGSQSNDITVDISAMPAATHGTTTEPSKEEMQWAILKGIMAIVGFKDDIGEPVNENAKSFLVTVPLALYPAAQAAVQPLLNAALAQNVDPNILADFSITVVPVIRLTWTDSFAVFRTDGPIKPLIRQTEQEIELKAKAEGSEFEFDNDAWQFGIDSWRGCGYGNWRYCCYVTLV